MTEAGVRMDLHESPAKKYLSLLRDVKDAVNGRYVAGVGENWEEVS